MEPRPERPMCMAAESTRSETCRGTRQDGRFPSVPPPAAPCAAPPSGAGPAAAPPSSAPPAAPPLSVLAAGDIGECGGKGDERTARLLAEHEGTILPLGDLAHESGTAQEFAACFGPSWGPFRDR